MDEVHPHRRKEDEAFTRRFVRRTSDVFLQYGALGAVAMVCIIGLGFTFKWQHDADLVRQQEQSTLIRIQGAALEDCRAQNVRTTTQVMEVVSKNTDAFNTFKDEVREMKAEVVNLGDRLTHVETAVKRKE